ncbi:MAG: hypothetical protein ACUBOA_06955 [Candidatus Loosdrechtia sp.]|uniref:hypothetical protein n=1 Tax=Candidatus Loosdrechtia sp. TaxID=3101272 RepID=UPI003A625A10|nr:MAG: hypothetical protein QY305_10080 [Candidatus Jettenia sp. AMX2]
MPVPQNPLTPNLSGAAYKGGRIVQDKTSNARVWWEMYLQESYTEEWTVDTNLHRSGPVAFTDSVPTVEGQEPLPPGSYCKDTKDVQKWRQPKGLYYYVAYTVEEKWAGWEIFGAALVVAGIVVLGFATGGTALGTDDGWFVAAAGGATALTTTLVATGATVAAIGGVVFKEAKTGEIRGKRIHGSEGYVHLPIGDADNYDTERQIVVRDWYPC